MFYHCATQPTDHAIRSLTIGWVHTREAKFCYCLRLQQEFIGAVDSTDQINFSNRQLYSAVKLTDCSVCGDTLQYSLEESISHRCTRQVIQLFTYLLTHKLFSSYIRWYLVSRACARVMPALSAVLLTFSFQFGLLFFHVSSQAAAASVVRGLANVGHGTFRKINYVCVILFMLILNWFKYA